MRKTPASVRQRFQAKASHTHTDAEHACINWTRLPNSDSTCECTANVTANKTRNGYNGNATLGFCSIQQAHGVKAMKLSVAPLCFYSLNSLPISRSAGETADEQRAKRQSRNATQFSTNVVVQPSKVSYVRVQPVCVPVPRLNKCHIDCLCLFRLRHTNSPF